MFILEETGCTYSELLPILQIIKFILKVIQYVVPVILILMGTIDLIKAVTQGKEDDIKKGQKTLISRAIAAVIVFLVPLIVSVIMGLIGTPEWKTCWDEAGNGTVMPDLENFDNVEPAKK